MSKQQSPAAPNSPVPSRSGSTTLIVVALLMGLITVILTQVYIAVIREEARGEVVTVYKLTRDVEPGHELEASKDLREVRIPAEFRESMSDAITPEALSNWNGEEILRPAPEGAPLTFDLFTAGGGALDRKITVGKRGTSLPLRSRSAPGLLRPGVFIDIKASLPVPGEPISRPIVVMERVKVVAVGSDTDAGGDGRAPNFSSITVEVEPEESLALLAVSKFIGRDGFDVDVRNPADQETRFVGINPEVLQLVGIE